MLLLLMPAGLIAQSDTTATATRAERHAFFAGAGYGSNMVYLGSTISKNQPYLYGAATYSLFEKLYLTGGAFNLPNLSRSDPAFYSASISFSQDIFKWLDMSAGLYRYMVKPELTDTLFGSFNYADVTLGIDWKILYTEVTCGAFVMKEPPAYLQVKNSRYFETPAFLRKKATVSFQPYVNLLFGTLGTTQIFEGTEIITTTNTYSTPVTITSGGGSGTGSGPGSSQGQGQGPGNSSTPGTTTTTTTTVTETITTEIPTYNTVYSEKFSMLEVELGLPVAFNLSNISLEAEVSYLHPFFNDPAWPSPSGFIFSFSAIMKLF